MENRFSYTAQLLLHCHRDLSNCCMFFRGILSGLKFDMLSLFFLSGDMIVRGNIFVVVFLH